MPSFSIWKYMQLLLVIVAKPIDVDCLSALPIDAKKDSLYRIMSDIQIQYPFWSKTKAIANR